MSIFRVGPTGMKIFTVYDERIQKMNFVTRAFPTFNRKYLLYEHFIMKLKNTQKHNLHNLCNKK
jgi:hypothetical protein